MANVLRMEFQPRFMAGKALRRVDQNFWETRVRPKVVPLNDPTCVICGFIAREKRSLIHADEVWDFPGAPNVILVNIRPVCVYCHDAKDYEYLLTRIAEGLHPPARADVVKRHYCQVNQCSEERFQQDYVLALEQKRAFEEPYFSYGDVVVDYGEWAPPKRSPRLTSEQRNLVEELFQGETPQEFDKSGEPIGGGRWFREEPIMLQDIQLISFGAAVRYLQSLRPEIRDSVISEMQDFAELFDDIDDDPLM